MFVVLEGKEGYGWWLWVVSGPDTVVYLLDASRSHAVPEDHFRAESRGVLVVDRYSAYKAMSLGQGRGRRPGLLLGSCAAGLHPGG